MQKNCHSLFLIFDDFKRLLDYDLRGFESVESQAQEIEPYAKNNRKNKHFMPVRHVYYINIQLYI